MLTKKKLAEDFNVSVKTVTRTLQVTPLGSSRSEYSEEEIQEFFTVARNLIDEGKSYEEVADYFGLKDEVGEQVPQQNLSNDSNNDISDTDTDSGADSGGDFATPSTSKIVEEQLSVAAAEAVNELSDRSVKNVAPFVGDLLMYKLAEELQEGGVIRKSIDETLEQVKTATPTQQGKVSGGAAFLLNKMKGGGLKQLAGTQTQTAQLPASSTESSETKSEQESQS